MTKSQFYCLDVGGPSPSIWLRMSLPSILVLIPACNEEGRIGPTLNHYAAHFRDHYDGQLEIVVVINGCHDDTLAVVQSVAREFLNIHWIVIPERVGKGGALIDGVHGELLITRSGPALATGFRAGMVLARESHPHFVRTVAEPPR